MDFEKVNFVALLVSLGAKSLSDLFHPLRNSGATSGGRGTICLKSGQNILPVKYNRRKLLPHPPPPTPPPLLFSLLFSFFFFSFPLLFFSSPAPLPLSPSICLCSSLSKCWALSKEVPCTIFNCRYNKLLGRGLKRQPLRLRTDSGTLRNYFIESTDN